MRSIRLLPLLFALVPAIGCGDDIKFPDQTELPDPVLNGVFPAKGFTDRTLRVEISGDGTEFTDAATVEFGPDITVTSVELASPGTLFANITIGAAQVGKRDVTVTNGDAELKLTAAFEVLTPLEIITDGPALQWGRNQMLIINRDPESPFLGSLEVTAGPGVTVVVDEQSRTETIVLAELFIDSDGATGPVVVNDILLDTVTSRGGNLEIIPRTPTALTAPGKGPTFQVLDATLTNTTAVFSYTANADGIWRTTTSVDVGVIEPTMFFLLDGKWANATGGGADDLRLLDSGATVNVVMFDDFFTGTVFDLAADNFHDLTGAVALAEVEDNDEFDGNGQVIPANQDVTIFTGLLNSDDTGFDDLVVTVNNGDRIRVTTTTGSAGVADTAVFVLDDTFSIVDGNGFETNSFCCGNLVGLAANDDVNEGAFLFASDTTSDPLPAGTYIVDAASSLTLAFGIPADDEPYEMAVTIIRAPQ
jgi:hypothetical protein